MRDYGKILLSLPHVDSISTPDNLEILRNCIETEFITKGDRTKPTFSLYTGVVLRGIKLLRLTAFTYQRHQEKTTFTIRPVVGIRKRGNLTNRNAYQAVKADDFILVTMMAPDAEQPGASCFQEYLYQCDFHTVDDTRQLQIKLVPESTADDIMSDIREQFGDQRDAKILLDLPELDCPFIKDPTNKRADLVGKRRLLGKMKTLLRLAEKKFPNTISKLLFHTSNVHWATALNAAYRERNLFTVECTNWHIDHVSETVRVDLVIGNKQLVVRSTGMKSRPLMMTYIERCDSD